MSRIAAPHAAQAEAAWQQLGPGIDLLNLCMAGEILVRATSRAAAWEAFRSATVMAHPQLLEVGVTDIDRLVERLGSILHDAGIARADIGVAALGPHVWAQGEAEPLLHWLDLVTALGDGLRDAGSAASDEALAQTWSTLAAVRTRLPDPAARERALQAATRQLEAAFTA